MVTAYLKFEAFNDKATKYFISSFETLRRRLLMVSLGIDLLRFKVDVESESTGPEAPKLAEDELEKDDATSWGWGFFIFIIHMNWRSFIFLFLVLNFW